MLLVALSAAGSGRAQEWGGAVAGGGEFNLTPEITGHGWLLFDALGQGVVGNGNLRLHYNTTKLHVGIERLSFAKGKMAFFGFLEGEALLSQLLTDYSKRGRRIRELGFNASYTLLSTKLQWYPGNYQTLELVLAARHWWFKTNANTLAGFDLPPNTFVFEPRIGYVFWKIDAPAEEWEAHRFFPRIRGIAFRISGGVDVRSRVASWGIADGRNEPERAIWTIRQSLGAGWQLAPLLRLQLDQWGSYGWSEDDITRNRIGGVNPYVIPVPGLPWTGLVSERVFSGQLGLHVRTGQTSRHEVGLLVGGGAFNDVARDGALATYGGAGGLSAVGDLRFGERDRFQLHLRFSWGFPVVWLLDGPYLAGLLSIGARVF